MSRIGFFDSGLGGLSVLRRALQYIPDAEYLYVADSGHAPYGGRGHAWVRRRSHAIAAYLNEQGIQALVIACNTATALAADSIRKDLDIPVIAMEPAVKPAAALTRSGRVGVLATATTLSSRRYLDLKGRYAQGIELLEYAPHHWIQAIESGEYRQPGFLSRLDRDLSPLLDQAVDTWVLACTHFPILLDEISAVVGESATIIDPAVAVIAQLSRRLPVHFQGEKAYSRPALKVFTSGDPGAVRGFAEAYLSREVWVASLDGCAAV